MCAREGIGIVIGIAKGIIRDVRMGREGKGKERILGLGREGKENIGFTRGIR